MIPVAAFVATLALALAINALVIARGAERDSGALWTWVLVWTGSLLALSLLYGWALQWVDAPWWSKGWHPLFDETGLQLDLPWLPALELKVRPPMGAGGQPLGHPYWWALALPFAVWLLVVLIGLVRPPSRRQPGQPRPGSWLAGAAGFAASRRWVNALALPVLVLLGWSADRLGDGPGNERAALWGTLAVTAINLIAIAFSRGRGPHPAAGPAPVVEPEGIAADWVAALRRRGFAVQTLARLEPIGDVPETQHPGARALARAMALSG